MVHTDQSANLDFLSAKHVFASTSILVRHISSRMSQSAVCLWIYEKMIIYTRRTKSTKDECEQPTQRLHLH